jgi:hypothetical protein
VSFLIRNLGQIVSLVGWTALWSLGGMWIARRAFNLRPNEQALVGLAIGLVMEDLLVNFLAFALPFGLACWIGVALVFIIGLVFALPGGREGQRSLRSLFSLRSFAIIPGQWLTFLVLVALFYAIGRGMAIFDDYAHLPTVSLMATGDVPPHFSLDPSVPYGYHYFLLLVAAQVVRLGDLFPWASLDFARALSLGLAVLLAAIWVQRLTRSRLAGVLGGAALAFSTGTRWLLLFLPPDFLNHISQAVQMIGSGSTSGADLASAMLRSWGMDGGGPFPFPFAFSNGLLNPGVVAFNGATGLMIYVPLLVLLLTFNRWRGWRGGLVSVFLVASSGLLSETGLALSLAAWVIITGVYAIKNKTLRLPPAFLAWWGVVVAGNLLSLLEGGAFTDLARNWLQNIVYGGSQVSYQTIGFQLVLTPAVVSSHLGVLSLLNGYQLIAALAELGPLILVLPLVCLWGIKAFRSGRWYEASFILSGVLSLGMLFVQYSGSTGVRNTSRLYTFVNLCLVYCVPLGWNWVQHRAQMLKNLAGVLLGMTMLSGLVLFAVEMIAIPKPVESYFLNELDGRMFKYYWDKLEPGALIFDPSPSRAPTVFGRATDSSLTWFDEKPAWKQLAAAPDPVKLKAAGFDYVYLDNVYWGNLDFASRDRLNSPCVKVIQAYENSMHETRQLLDIRACH